MRSFAGSLAALAVLGCSAGHWYATPQTEQERLLIGCYRLGPADEAVDLVLDSLQNAYWADSDGQYPPRRRVRVNGEIAMGVPNGWYPVEPDSIAIDLIVGREGQGRSFRLALRSDSVSGTVTRSGAGRSPSSSSTIAGRRVEC